MNLNDLTIDQIEAINNIINSKKKSNEEKENIDFSEFDDFEWDKDKDPNILDIKLYPVIESFVKEHNYLSCIMGPVGSGKSTGNVVKIFLYSMAIKKCKDGIRRSKWIIVRNTRKELKDTTVKTFLQWMGRFGKFHSTDMNFIMKFNDVESEIQFIALDDEKDAKKLLSLECTGIYFNELREINKEIWLKAMTRIGRFPSWKANGTRAWFDMEKVKEFGLKVPPPDPREKNNVTMKCLFGDTNPPNIGSYYHKLFEGLLFSETGRDENPKDFKLYKQPSGLSPNAENRHNIDADYYERFVQNNTKETVDVDVHVQYGLGQSGLAVYRDYFDYSTHVKTNLFEQYYTRNYKLAIGMDFGLNPAVVIGQVIKGVLYIYEEIATMDNNKKTLEEFLIHDLVPLIQKKYTKHKLNEEDIVVFPDPAGKQREGYTGNTALKMLKNWKFRVRLDTDEENNRISPRLDAVKLMLRKDTGKGDYITTIQIDEKCATLIAGFNGNYFYEKEKNTGYKNEICKNQYSHIQDAVQYLCKHIRLKGTRYLDIYKSNSYDDNYASAADSMVGY